ncbi:uncharacterized protein LOC119939315 [Tachyglossus aculeatus]|uniref:uncharacterized protein LOC119939315 n=1 Tax=Tachyglossus aculeatus TaxID=9261 RepID=UPI0018F5567C|nr:uncharacterized protein LOC119939315 [Tachyglossus aculeatus]
MAAALCHSSSCHQGATRDFAGLPTLLSKSLPTDEHPPSSRPRLRERSVGSGAGRPAPLAMNRSGRHRLAGPQPTASEESSFEVRISSLGLSPPPTYSKPGPGSPGVGRSVALEAPWQVGSSLSSGLRGGCFVRPRWVSTPVEGRFPLRSVPARPGWASERWAGEGGPDARGSDYASHSGAGVWILTQEWKRKRAARAGHEEGQP